MASALVSPVRRSIQCTGTWYREERSTSIWDLYCMAHGACQQWYSSTGVPNCGTVALHFNTTSTRRRALKTEDRK
jgi:hypothetical protein